MLWRAVVRDDPKRGDAFKASPEFENSTRKAAAELDSDYWGRDSLSGNERNRFFINRQGARFDDVSLLSGADHVGDGRSVVLFDYDRDGLTDIASINTNAPKLVMFRNQAAGVTKAGQNHFVALRFVGGNTSGTPQAGASNRDGYGTRVEFDLEGRKFVVEHRCGEGYSAQNSRSLHIGLGAAKSIPEMTVVWPSGKRQQLQDVPADRRITIFENPQASESAMPFKAEPYLRPE